MKLCSVSLAGFKSFAGKFVLPLEGRRIGVVGPNGCGKSNLLDAIRWVMGESQASQLRQEIGADFLFNGSERRKKADWCSVEIKLSNDGTRDLGMWGSYPEISVKRQLERDGDNRYLINGQRVRRRDVVDLFAGTGAGARSYNVVEQEQITRIVRSEPQRIRAHLEEAAGVATYKDRRRETERKICMANDNLAMFGERIGEIERQISLLSRQTKLSVRARNLRAQAEAARKLALLLRIEALCEQCAGRKRQVAEAVRARAETGGRLQAGDERADGLRDKRRKSDAEQSAAQSGHYTALAEFERWRTVRREADEARERDRKGAAEANETVSRTEAAAAGLRAGAAQLAGEAGTMKERAEQEKRRHAAVAADLAAAAERAQGAQARLRKAESAISAAAAAEHAVRNAQEVCELRLADLAAVRQEAVRELEVLPAESSVDGGKLQRLREAAAAAAAAVRKSEAKIALQHNDVAVLREELIRQQAQLGGFLAERELLLKVNCGDKQDAQEWEKRRGLLEASRLTEISGLSAPGFERAVDAGLHRLAAGKMMNLDSLLDGDAEEPPEGRTYIDMQAPSVAGAAEEAATSVKGLELLAAKVVTSNGYTARIRRWLSGKYIAANLGVAIGSRRFLRSGEEIFTPDGVCVGSDFVHGPPRFDTGLEWDASMRGNDAKISAIRVEIGRTKKQAGNLAAALADEQENCAALQRAQHETDLSFAAQEQEDVRLRHETDFLRERRRRLAGVVDRTGRDSAKRMAELGEAGKELVAVVGRRESCDWELSMARDGVSGVSAAMEELRATAAEHQNAERSARQSALHCGQRIADMEQRIAEQVQLGDGAQRRLAEIGERLRAGKETSIDEHLAAAAAAEDRARQKLAQTCGLAESSAAAEIDAEQRNAQLRAALAEAADRLRVEEVELSASSAELGSLEQRLGELGGADERVARLREACPSAGEAAEHARKLEGRLEKIGPVNYGADEQLSVCAQALAEQQGQRQDLSIAMGSLEEAIRRIDKEMLERLKGVFARLNEKFAKLFRFLFDGGDAEIVMSGDSLLDSRLELRANPPGKRVTSIQSLSGGEKSMTALAFLFALNEMNPPPFCLLDEVDAMLDEDNTRRFCKLLDTVGERIQFVLVTHNKSVIETADTLVGVTQEEKGVSKIVTVDLDQAMAAAVAAGAA